MYESYALTDRPAAYYFLLLVYSIRIFQHRKQKYYGSAGKLTRVVVMRIIFSLYDNTKLLDEIKIICNAQYEGNWSYKEHYKDTGIPEG